MGDKEPDPCPGFQLGCFHLWQRQYWWEHIPEVHDWLWLRPCAPKVRGLDNSSQGYVNQHRILTSKGSEATHSTRIHRQPQCSEVRVAEGTNRQGTTNKTGEHRPYVSRQKGHLSQGEVPPVSSTLKEKYNVFQRRDQVGKGIWGTAADQKPGDRCDTVLCSGTHEG